jgi:hypothetical protein
LFRNEARGSTGEDRHIIVSVLRRAAERGNGLSTVAGNVPIILPVLLQTMSVFIASFVDASVKALPAQRPHRPIVTTPLHDGGSRFEDPAMLSIEQSLVERLPWLARYPAIRRPVSGMLGRLADEDGFNRVLSRVGTAEGFDFVERVLDALGTSYQLNLSERKHIPLDGLLLVVTKHPLGMQDALALLQLIISVRPDVRILGNDWLATEP